MTRDLTPLELKRAGHPVTLQDKLRMVSCLDELKGFTDQLGKSLIEVTVEDQAAIKERRRVLSAKGR
jgi:hypothetical protein